VIPLVVPYTQLRPETRAALADQDVTFVDVSGGDDHYFWLVQALWHRAEGAIIIEHDVVPYPGAIDALRGCPGDWCGVPTLVGINWRPFHGCVKFSAELMARHPDTVNRLEDHHWQAFDGPMDRYLLQQGEHVHMHWPAARHLNDCGDETRVLANCGECGGPLRFADLKAGPGETLCPRCGRHTNHFTHG
jgi:hypothetical protein